MAKRTKGAVTEGLAPFDNDAEGIIGDTNLAQVIESNMLVYGTMTVEDRAIADWRDGQLKLYRRLLWAMHRAGLRSDGGLVKSASVVGDTMKSYHPHGDQSIYGGLVTMNGFADSYVDGVGNWGSLTSPKPAAMRYTECKLTPLAERIILDPYNLSIIEEVPNFDSRTTEPLVFVPNLPMLLVHGLTGGIAVGVTAEIPCFTLESVQQLVRAAMARTLKKKKLTKVTARDCARLLRFRHHTGGHVTSSLEEVTEFFGSNEGRITWVADFEWLEDKGETYCSITGIPPMWGYKGKIDKLESLPEVKQVANFKTKGGQSEVRVVLKRGSLGEIEAAQAKVEALLTSAVTYRINLIERYRQVTAEEGVGEIVEAKARFFTCSIAELINMWIKWRVGQHKLALAADLERLQVKLTREELLLRAIGFLDQMVEMLRNKTKGFDKVQALADLMGIDVETAREVWAISIGRFDRLNEAEQVAKIAKLQREMRRLRADLKQPFKATYRYIAAATN